MAAVKAVGVKASAARAVAATVAATVVAMEAGTAQLTAAATEWVTAVAMKVAVMDAAVVLVVDLASATVEAATEAGGARRPREAASKTDGGGVVRRQFRGLPNSARLHKRHRNHRGRLSVVWKSYEPRDV